MEDPVTIIILKITPKENKTLFTKAFLEIIVLAICCIEGIFNSTLSPSFWSPLLDGELLSDLKSLKSGGTSVVYDGSFVTVFAFVFAFVFIFIFVFVFTLLLVLERVIPALLSECGLYDNKFN